MSDEDEDALGLFELKELLNEAGPKAARNFVEHLDKTADRTSYILANGTSDQKKLHISNLVERLKMIVMQDEVNVLLSRTTF